MTRPRPQIAGIGNPLVDVVANLRGAFGGELAVEEEVQRRQRLLTRLADSQRLLKIGPVHGANGSKAARASFPSTPAAADSLTSPCATAKS